MQKKIITLAILLKGFTSVIAQTLLIRELLVVFYGNELTFSLILCAWLASGAIGSGCLARLFKTSSGALRPYSAFLLLSNIWLVIALIIIRTSKSLLGVSFAEVLNLNHIIFIIALSLFIFSLCDGVLFSMGFRLLQSFTRMYILESCGVIAGGILFTFLFLKIFNSFQIIFLLLSLNMFCLGLLYLYDKARLFKIVAWLPLCFAFFLFSHADTWQRITLEKQWLHKNIILYENSLYGNIAVAQEKSQYTIFYDGLPTINIPAPETFFTEDFIHLPLSVKPSSKKILFIGHAAGGLLAETLKYPVEKIVYAETDPLFVDCLRVLPDKFLQKELNDKRVIIEMTDGRSYLKTTPEKFDCIFVNTDLPTSLSINRYATKEFFGEVKKALAPNGIAVFKTWGSLAYLSDELKKINASLYKTLFSKFPYVEVIPGDGFNIFIASASEIKFQTYKMYWNLTDLKIKTYLINPTYLELRLQKAAIDEFWAAIKGELKNASINQDLKPSGLYEALNLYYAQFSKKIPKIFSEFKKVHPEPLAIFLVLFYFLYGLLLHKRRLYFAALHVTAFNTGFFCMSLQIMTLFLFQSFLGYLFQWLALLTTSFMVGAAAGASVAQKFQQRLNTIKKLSVLEIVLPTISAAFVFSAVGLFPHNAYLQIFCRWIFCLISATAGYLAGLEIPIIYGLAVKIPHDASNQKNNRAGGVYALDLVGACLGALVTPLILIPSCGIPATIVILWIFKAGNGLALAVLKGKNDPL